MRIRTEDGDALDFCRKCFPPTQVAALSMYGRTKLSGRPRAVELELEDKYAYGMDEEGFCYDDAHPSYDSGDYDCEACGKKLGIED